MAKWRLKIYNNSHNNNNSNSSSILWTVPPNSSTIYNHSLFKTREAISTPSISINNKCTSILRKTTAPPIQWMLWIRINLSRALTQHHPSIWLWILKNEKFLLSKEEEGCNSWIIIRESTNNEAHDDRDMSSAETFIILYRIRYLSN